MVMIIGISMNKNQPLRFRFVTTGGLINGFKSGSQTKAELLYCQITFRKDIL